MEIIKLNAIDSTNSYLRQLCTKKDLEDLTVVLTKSQFEGRGQMGTTWESEPGKNLICSVYKALGGLAVEESFAVSMITSLAIIKTLKQFSVPKLSVKWPNDILSENKKVCGILIENILKNSRLEASIIGIGLNVNQTLFNNLPLATSIKNLTGTLFDADELLHGILEHLQYYFKMYGEKSFQAVKTEYEVQLFRKGKPSTFKTTSGELFPGFIEGIDDAGNLILKLEDGIIKAFGLKEIQLLY